MTLPIEKFRVQIVETVQSNQVTIVVGETGSGKTTMLPIYLYQAGLSWTGRIGVTEPRRLAAASVARFVERRIWRDTGKENVVAYKVRFDNTTDPNTEIKFMTDGVLLREFHEDKQLSKYSVIIIDEAHERSANVDFLLGLLKQLLKKRADLKLVVASATIDAEKFSAYFDSAPIIHVEGRQHPVEIVWNKHDCGSPKEMLDESISKVLDMHRSDKKGDILVFFPGIEMINSFLGKIEGECLEDLIALPAHSLLTNDELQRIFQSYQGKRKVIAATNIAETSITIDNISCVVDCGYIKQSEFYPRTGIEGLDVIEHSQAGCNQRAGRAGRTRAGMCYRLYTEENYKKRRAFTETELRRMSLAGVMLMMEALEIPGARDFEFIDMPKQIAIDEAYETLEVLGAMESGKSGLTELGKEMATLPLEPGLARMVLEARRHDCVEDIVTIASFLTSNRPLYVQPKDKLAEVDAVHRRFQHPRSDMLTLLNIWKAYDEVEGDEGWCERNFLVVKSMQEVTSIRNQLLRYLNQLGVKVTSTSDQVVIMRSIAAGLAYNLLSHVSRHAYSGVLRKAEKVYIHPKSALFGGLFTYRWIVAAEVFSTTKLYAYKCSVVQPEWLPEIAPDKFSFGQQALKGSAKKGWVVRQWVEYKNRKGVIARAGEVTVGNVPLKKAIQIQEECVRDAESKGWILITIGNGHDSFEEVAGHSVGGVTYPIVDPLAISSDENKQWYCTLDSSVFPGKTYARPQFPVFDFSQEEACQR